MKNFILVLISAFIIISCNQKNTDSTNQVTQDKDAPESLLKFIPENYQILDTARGDLNLDGIDDLIMVLETKPEVVVLGSEESDIRPMLLLVTNQNGEYQLAKRNFKAIYCKGCIENIDEPFSQAVIHGGQFGIIQKGNNWKRTSIFSFEPNENEWFLNSDELSTTEKALSPLDFGKIKFEDFNIYKD